MLLVMDILLDVKSECKLPAKYIYSLNQLVIVYVYTSILLICYQQILSKQVFPPPINYIRREEWIRINDHAI